MTCLDRDESILATGMFVSKCSEPCDRLTKQDECLRSILSMANWYDDAHLRQGRGDMSWNAQHPFLRRINHETRRAITHRFCTKHPIIQQHHSITVSNHQGYHSKSRSVYNCLLQTPKLVVDVTKQQTPLLILILSQRTSMKKNACCLQQNVSVFFLFEL